jgi:hypothetical protein
MSRRKAFCAALIRDITQALLLYIHAGDLAFPMDAHNAMAQTSQAAEKGPSAALARLGARCGVPGVRLTRPFARRLESGPF